MWRGEGGGGGFSSWDIIGQGRGDQNWWDKRTSYVYILFYMVVLTVYVKLLENIYERLFLMSLQTKIQFTAYYFWTAITLVWVFIMSHTR